MTETLYFQKHDIYNLTEKYNIIQIKENKITKISRNSTQNLKYDTKT